MQQEDFIKEKDLLFLSQTKNSCQVYNKYESEDFNKYEEQLIIKAKFGKMKKQDEIFYTSSWNQNKYHEQDY